MPEAYKRYITNQLRKTFELRVPLQLFFRERPGKAKRAARKTPSRPSLTSNHPDALQCAPFPGPEQEGHQDTTWHRIG